jgi:hydrogenase nickel incorporation protein HypA/HybF
MHELSVTENILSIALNHAKLNQAKKVTDVYLVIGKLASIVDDSVQFYWDFLTENTLCSGSNLHFKRIDASFTCKSCQNTFSLEDRLSPCPHCGSLQIEILSGEEFYLDSIEIEKE